MKTTKKILILIPSMLLVACNNVNPARSYTPNAPVSNKDRDDAEELVAITEDEANEILNEIKEVAFPENDNFYLVYNKDIGNIANKDKDVDLEYRFETYEKDVYYVHREKGAKANAVDTKVITGTDKDYGRMAYINSYDNMANYRNQKILTDGEAIGNVDTYALGIKNDVVKYIEPIFNDLQTKALNFKATFGDNEYQYYKVANKKGSLHIQFKNHPVDDAVAEGDEHLYMKGIHIDFRDFKFSKFYTQETTNYGNFKDEMFFINYTNGAFEFPPEVKTFIAKKD